MTQTYDEPGTKTELPSDAHPAFATLPTLELTVEARKIWMDEVQPIVEAENPELALKMDRALSGLNNRLTVLMEERA